MSCSLIERVADFSSGKRVLVKRDGKPLVVSESLGLIERACYLTMFDTLGEVVDSEVTGGTKINREGKYVHNTVCFQNGLPAEVWCWKEKILESPDKKIELTWDHDKGQIIKKKVSFFDSHDGKKVLYPYKTYEEAFKYNSEGWLVQRAVLEFMRIDLIKDKASGLFLYDHVRYSDDPTIVRRIAKEYKLSNSKTELELERIYGAVIDKVKGRRLISGIYVNGSIAMIRNRYNISLEQKFDPRKVVSGSEKFMPPLLELKEEDLVVDPQTVDTGLSEVE